MYRQTVTVTIFVALSYVAAEYVKRNFTHDSKKQVTAIVHYCLRNKKLKH